MSASEQLLKRVASLTEADAKAALRSFDTHRSPETKPVEEAELRQMDQALGFARTYRTELKTTAEWMNELREGETDFASEAAPTLVDP